MKKVISTTVQLRGSREQVNQLAQQYPRQYSGINDAAAHYRKGSPDSGFSTANRQSPAPSFRRSLNIKDVQSKIFK